MARTIRLTGAVRHEAGHAFDDALGTPSRELKFLLEYQDDMAQIHVDHRARLAYFLQPGAAGRSEVFAEVFAQIHGGGGFEGAMLEYFPRCAALIRDWIAKGAL
jgi:hypothetical protein